MPPFSLTNRAVYPALMVSPFADIAIAQTDVPAEKLADNSFAEYAAKELGRFEVIDKVSKLEGCR